MKAEALFQIIKSLSEEEMKRLKGILNAEPDGKDLIQMVGAMRVSETFKRAELRKSLKVGATRLNTLLEKINTPLFGLFANQNAEAKLYNALITANKLVFRMVDQAAIDVMEWAFKEAARVERFDISLQLLELATILTTPHEFDSETKSNLIKNQITYLAYQEIEDQFRTVLKPGIDKEGKSSSLDQIAASELLSSRKRATSKRVLAIYLKVSAVLRLINKNEEEAIALQSEFIALLEQNSWLNIENDFFLIQESKALSRFYKVNGNVQEANALIFSIGNKEWGEPKLEFEKERQLYPFRVIVAILSGDAEIAEEAINATLAMIKQRKCFQKPHYITQNLYYCAYAYFAFGQFQKAGRIFNMLAEYKENTRYFSEQILPMAKILKMVNLVSMGEMVKVPGMIHSFRNNSNIGSSPYFKLMLGLLFRLSNRGSGDWKLILHKYLQDTRELKKNAPAIPQFHFFDTEHWLESMLEGGSMAEHLHHRTSATTNDSADQIQA